MTAGALPTNLNLSSAGVIPGTPSVAGTFTGTVTASNTILPNATQNFSITINGPPAITNGPPPSPATVGTAYNFTYTSSGTPAPTFGVTAGVLPGGLSLSSAGVISGTPNAAGVFSGTVTATNSVGTATQNFSITITQPPVGITPNTANLAQNATTLIINGNGFSTTVGNNTVVLSSGTASVTAATATQLTCTLGGPPSLGALNATVTVTGTGSTGPTQVATIVGSPTVTPNTANRAQNAPTLLIAGTNFSATAGDNTVAFNLGATGTVTAATATQVTVTFSTPPSTTGSLTANVTVFGGSSGATQVATIVGSPTVTLNTTNLPFDAPTITITGTNFSGTAGDNTVVFNLGAIGTVTAATLTSLTVTFTSSPNAPGSLTAVVTSNTISSGAAVQVATVSPSVIESWRQFYFGTYANTGTAANTADSDGDTLSNLLEFAFGTNPTINNSNALIYTGTFAGLGTITATGQPITLFESIPNGIDFRAVFVRRKDFVAAGLTYTPEFSVSRSTWQPSAVVPTVLADDGTYQIVSVPYPAFISGKKAKFFRISVSIAP